MNEMDFAGYGLFFLWLATLIWSYSIHDAVAASILIAAVIIERVIENG